MSTSQRNRRTTTSTATYQPTPLWSPQQVLEVQPGCCSGITQRGARCKQRMFGHADIDSADKILNDLKFKDPKDPASKTQLKELAYLTLCPRWHRRDGYSQLPEVIARWQRAIRDLAGSTQASRPLTSSTGVWPRDVSRTRGLHTQPIDTEDVHYRRAQRRQENHFNERMQQQQDDFNRRLNQQAEEYDRRMEQQARQLRDAIRQLAEARELQVQAQSTSEEAVSTSQRDMPAGDVPSRSTQRSRLTRRGQTPESPTRNGTRGSDVSDAETNTSPSHESSAYLTPPRSPSNHRSRQAATTPFGIASPRPSRGSRSRSVHSHSGDISTNNNSDTDNVVETDNVTDTDSHRYSATVLHSEPEPISQGLSPPDSPVTPSVSSTSSVTEISITPSPTATTPSSTSAGSTTREPAPYVPRRQPLEECAICLNDLRPQSTSPLGAAYSSPQIVYCRAQCGYNFHLDCMEHWRRAQQSAWAARQTWMLPEAERARRMREAVLCPMCRTSWEFDGDHL